MIACTSVAGRSAPPYDKVSTCPQGVNKKKCGPDLCDDTTHKCVARTFINGLTSGYGCYPKEVVSATKSWRVHKSQS